MERHFLRLAGGILSYLVGGKGPPVVLIHGAGNRAEIWKELFPVLTEGYTLYVLDLPGHGLSSYIPCPRIEDYSSRVLEFLEAADLRGVALVGHSMGGAIVLKTGPFSKRVAALVLVGTGARLRVNPRLLSMLKDDFPRGIELMARWSFPKGAPQELLDEAKEMFWQSGQAVLYQDMLACDLYSAREDLGDISLPTLIVCGERDVMTPPDLSRELQRGIRGAELRLVEGAGHMVHRENGEEVARLISSFLDAQLKGG